MKIIDAAFRSNVLFSYGSQALKLALGFAWATLLVKQAGIELYGAITLLTALAAMTSALLTFRTNEAVVQFHRLAEHQGDHGMARLALLAGLALDAIGACVILVSAYLLAPLISKLLLKDAALAPSVELYSWVMVAIFVRGTGIGLLAARDRFKVINVFIVMEQLGKLLILIWMLYIGIELSLENIVWVILLVTGFTTACLLGLVSSELVASAGQVLPLSELRRYFRFTVSTFVSSSLKAATQNVDSLIVGGVAGPASAGFYGLIKQFLSPLLILVGPFTEQIHPRFVSAVADKRFVDILQTITDVGTKIWKWSAVLSLCISVAISIYWVTVGLPMTATNVLAFVFLLASTLLLQQLWWTRGLALSINPGISIRANVYYGLVMLSAVTTLAMLFGLAGGACGVLVTSVVIVLYWRGILRKWLPSTGSRVAS
ncbi:oligosaccharide flippase family protein [Luteimonas sp. MC1828]|uniref:lipopolysaccharide biosynthesis protein n=1 Tax=Luteimonas sp. MC1828 TaxID=2799787 RepID=UPI0018F243C0|nr:oligosaccharide flippase family protein [Luteimonas sp. MC1828]MBJ7574396.1 oligosaccharide flippase family protein [Luteimonas sp. MC1828]